MHSVSLLSVLWFVFFFGLSLLTALTFILTFTFTFSPPSSSVIYFYFSLRYFFKILFWKPFFFGLFCFPLMLQFFLENHFSFACFAFRFWVLRRFVFCVCWCFVFNLISLGNRGAEKIHHFFIKRFRLFIRIGDNINATMDCFSAILQYTRNRILP